MTATRPAPDVAVVGGGIVGCSVAAFLAEGGVRVRLYEESAIAAGASGRNSGIVQHPFDPVMAALYRATIAEYGALADVGGVPFRLPDVPAGLLDVGHDERVARDHVALWAAAWPATRPEVIAGSALTALEPALADGLVACRLEIGYPVAPAAATEAFASLARRRGAEIVVGGGPARLVVGDGRVVGVERDGAIESAGAVVVAAGPWTPAVVDPSGAWRPIRRTWGVVASIVVPGAPRHAMEASDLKIEPDEDGESLSDQAGRDDAVGFSLVPGSGSSSLGSTFLPDQPDPEAWLAALRRVGSRYVPVVADAPLLGLRRCARPVSRDGRPLLGAAPWDEGLWIAAGHGPWGISTGPGSARLLADAILGRGLADVIPDALRVDRFGPPAPPAASVG